MSLKDRLLERTWVYRAWQAPFQAQKFAPVRRHNDLTAVRRVLDVGCGPGTNTGHFLHADYLGIDINPRYVEAARRRWGRDFLAADVTRYEVGHGGFDFILANSFFHHIDDADTDRILAHLATLLAPDGHVHVLDLVLPPGPSPARMLAKLDRGDHPRPLERWREIFSRHFRPVVFEPYPLGVLGVTLWSMVYFKGAPRR
ncbi:MAG: class I SAM-dependent methyltransferase [Gemmatimonadetes bacterium]|nr:MAG: class I SAM-dependent methyltransferase [Gemmatimonadota bacterium]